MPFLRVKARWNAIVRELIALGQATACEPTAFPPPNVLINLQLQSDRQEKPEKFPMIDEALQENANAFSSLCFSIRAISGPLLEYKERFCIVVEQSLMRLV